MNLARAALTAQGAIAEMALRQADRPAALSPDPFHVGPALTEVMGRLAAQPDRMMRAQADLFARYLDLWQSPHLLELATQLKDEVDKTSKDTLSLNVIRKAESIEKLAHGVKEKMKLTMGASS